MRQLRAIWANQVKMTGRRADSVAAILLLALAMQGFAMAQSATVITDKSDYAPGEVVTITGSGWQPGETVTLQLVESPLIDVPPLMTAVADANGNIFNDQFAPDRNDLDISFTLTATGSLSGFKAQTTFTDSINSISITSSVFTIPVNTCSPAITMTCGGNNSTINLSSTSAGGKFYASLANCSSQTSPITTDGNSCDPNPVYYRDSNAGTPTITVTANSKQAQQTETITSSPTKLVFTNTPVTMTTGACSGALTVQSQDASGNPWNPASTETLAPSSSSTGGSFYTNNSCSTAVTGSNLTIPTSTNSATFYYKDTKSGSPVITVTGSGAFAATGANAATQPEIVSGIARKGQTIVATLFPKDKAVSVRYETLW